MRKQRLKMLEFNIPNRRLTVDGKDVPLKRQNWKVMRYMIENPDRLLTMEMILDRCWPDRYVGDRNVARAISDIRRDVGKAHAVAFETLYGEGYRFNPKKCEYKVIKE